MKFTWLAALIPAMGGLAAAALISSLAETIPVAYLRADLGTLALIAGVVLSLHAGAGIAISEWTQHKAEEIRNRVQDQAAGERRRFLRRLDHELKNPLTAIRAGLANISESPSDEARRLALFSVDNQAMRLSRLAADLRKLAELEIRPLESRPVDMTSLLEEAFSITQERPEADQRKLALTIPSAPWPLPEVSGDHDLLFLAFHNLLDNALKFTRPGDTVEVRAFEDGAQVVVEIADTGPGILAEDVDHVWEELYRSKSAHGIPGSGLGLTLVRAVTERHNGQVNLRSRAGQGTVFTIKLPADKANSVQ
jgi:two-component system, OmpR family, sensor kinase